MIMLCVDKKLIFLSENLAALADEVYEIQKDGSLKKVSAAEIEEEPSDEEDAGKEASKDRNASTGIDPPPGDTEATKTNTATETKSNKVESSKLIGDRLVYLRYIRAMGYPNAIIFLLTGIIFAVAFMFPSKLLALCPSCMCLPNIRFMGAMVVKCAGQRRYTWQRLLAWLLCSY
jgi:hypothetical protein